MRSVPAPTISAKSPEDWLHPAADLEPAVRFFDTYGYVGVAGLLGSDELERLDDAYAQCVQSGALTVREHGMVVENDVIDLHPAFLDAICSPALVSAARSMLAGVPIELQHSKIAQRTLEDTGEGALDWHQDFPFFPHTNFDLVAAIIHLDDEEVASGPIQVIPGSHRLGPLSHLGSDGTFAYRCTSQDVPLDEQPVMLHGPAGTITFHHCLTVHGSAPKTNRTPRRYLIPQYRAQDAVQLAGVMWGCTGREVMERVEPRYARLPDGTRFELRGREGRIYDRAGQLAPTL